MSFDEWMIEVYMPELREKFPESTRPSMTIRGRVHAEDHEACPEVEKLLEDIVEGIRTGGHEAHLFTMQTVGDGLG